MANQSKFYIHSKKEFIVTFSRDFTYLNKPIIKFELEEIFKKHNFDYIIGEEHNKAGELHYHIYLKCNKKHGFSTRDVRYFDIKLPYSIVSFYEVTGACHEQKKYEDFNYDKRNIEQYITDSPSIKDYKILDSAHPNIVFKGDKKLDYCKDTKSMISYVTKEDKNPCSNFDWIKVLADNPKKRKMDELIEEEKDFYEWIRLQVSQGVSEKQLWEEIKKNSSKFYIAVRNYNNTKKVIQDFFKGDSIAKPIPYIGTYWVPIELFNYLTYLDNWIKMFHEEIIWKLEEDDELKFDDLWEDFVKRHPERPKSCYIKGPGNCGKTSLFSCFKSFSYWCNGWNYSNYELNQAFNLFDDYDGQCGGGNWDSNDFNYLKPWFAGQQVVSISGKYKAPKGVKNHKPMVFISNYDRHTRFNEENNQYLKEIGCTFIELNKHLKEKPERHSIGGFAGFREFNFKNTWTYENLYEEKHKDKQPKYDSEPEASGWEEETPKNYTLNEWGCWEEEEFEPTIEDFEEVYEKREKGKEKEKENREGVNITNFTPNNTYKTTIGLDGSTEHIAKNNFFDKIIKEINKKIKEEERKVKMYESINHDCEERKKVLMIRYDKTFDRKIAMELRLSIKDRENIRMDILNEIRELNDTIDKNSLEITKSLDRISNYVDNLIHVYNRKKHTYK